MLLIEAAMANPVGESSGGFLRLDFNRRLMVQFRGSIGTSDAGLAPTANLADHYWELPDMPIAVRNSRLSFREAGKVLFTV